MTVYITNAEARKWGFLPKMPATKQPVSELEEAFAQLWKTFGNGMEPERKYKKFIPGRKFEADFAWPEQKLIVEMDGQRAHVHKWGKQRDSERDRLSVLNGWRVLRYTSLDLRIRPIQCVEEVIQALNQRI